MSGLISASRPTWLPVATIAVGAFLNPGAALLTDYLAFGRVLTPLQALGLLLILVAGLAINMGWKGFRKRRESPT